MSSESLDETVDALFEQVIGGQSLMYRVFRQPLGCEEQAIRPLELTYFACALMTAVYLRFGKALKRDMTMDQVSLKVLRTTVPDCGEAISIGTAVRECQKRYAEYANLLSLVFGETKSITGAPEVTVLLHLFECVTGTTARGQMLKLVSLSQVFMQFVTDHIDFVNDRLNK